MPSLPTLSFGTIGVQEVRVVTMDFAANIPVGASIQSATVTAIIFATSAVATITNGSPSVQGTMVLQKISGVVDGVTYVLVFVAVLSNGETVELAARLYGEAFVPTLPS